MEQARRQNKASAAYAAVAASGTGDGNEDDEVYAVAKAVDDADDAGYDEDDFATVAADKKRIDLLPALDHANIEYEGFAKDFYEEAPEIAQLPAAEVRLALLAIGFSCQHCAQTSDHVSPSRPCNI